MMQISLRFSLPLFSRGQHKTVWHRPHAELNYRAFEPKGGIFCCTVETSILRSPFPQATACFSEVGELDQLSIRIIISKYTLNIMETGVTAKH